MVVVVDVPDRDCCCSFSLCGERAGVEQLLGDDAVVALDFAVVLGRIGLDLLVPGRVRGGAGEGCGSVAGSVVGDHTGDLGDAVGGEPGSGSGPESDCCAGFLVG